MDIKNQAVVAEDLEKDTQSSISDFKTKKTDNENKHKSSQEKMAVEMLGKYIACFSALCTIISLLGIGFLKFISLGRCMYFQFDIEYYDFSLSNLSTFIFIFFLACSFISLLQSIIINRFYRKIKDFLKKHCDSFVLNVLLIILLFIFDAFATFYFYKLTIPDEYLADNAAGLSVAFCIFISFITYSICGGDISKKTRKISIIIAALILLTISFAFINVEYNGAKNQHEFTIISCDKDTYVVISKSSSRFSAYKCNINDGVLSIITNDHKYINIEGSEAVQVKFNDVDYIKKPVKTADEYMSSKGP